MGNVNYTPILSVEGEKEYIDNLNKLKYIKVDDMESLVTRFMRPDMVREIIINEKGTFRHSRHCRPRLAGIVFRRSNPFLQASISH